MKFVAYEFNNDWNNLQKRIKKYHFFNNVTNKTRQIFEGNDFFECVENEEPDLAIYNTTVNILSFDQDKIATLLDKYHRSSFIDYKRIDPINYKPIPLLIIYDGLMHRNLRSDGLQYFDSSIWQRWVNVENYESYYHELAVVLRYFKNCFDYKLYDKDVTKEYCEFSTRLFYNSYLIGYSHSPSVVPFPFSKEGEFEKKVCDHFTDIENARGYTTKQMQVRFEIINLLNSVSWRILLIDDRADKDDSSWNIDEPKRPWKFTYIKKILGSYFNVFEDDGDIQNRNPSKPTLFFKTVQSVDQAILDLTKTNYDILLFDYLLGDKPGGGNGERELSVDILKKLRDDDNLCRKGPGGRFWIFPITSFGQAFMDHVHEEGMQLQNDIWTIERGADPVNTPNAFLYYFMNLLELMAKQFEYGKCIEEMWKGYLRGIKENDVRAWANITMNRLLNYTEKIKGLKEISYSATNTGGSRFAQSIAAIVKDEYSSYLIHFLFMLAYCDGGKWDVMKNSLENIKSVIKDKNYEKIKEHIDRLKAEYE